MSQQSNTRQIYTNSPLSLFCAGHVLLSMRITLISAIFFEELSIFCKFLSELRYSRYYISASSFSVCRSSKMSLFYP